MNLRDSTAVFDDCIFRNNGIGTGNMVSTSAALQGSPVKVTFNHCDFTDNRCPTKIEPGQEGKYEFNDCTETNNDWSESVLTLSVGANVQMTLVRSTGEAVFTGTGQMGYTGNISNEVKAGIVSAIVEPGITDTGFFFSSCVNLEKVSLPDTLTELGMFMGAKKLTKIEIPDSVTSISNSAFCDCTGLREINIPSGVTYIGSSAFSGCTGLESVKIPDSVTVIESSAFSDCTGLESISIPDQVTRINSGTFYGCTGLKSVNIPDSVTGIDSAAFCDCTALESIHIPDGVTEIGSYAFQKCTGLTEIILPDSVAKIDGGAFTGCSGLKSVNIPEGVTVINGSVFGNCASLTEMIIPEGVTTISYGAFQGCSGLKKLVIPGSVTDIAYRVFEDCTGLEELTLPATLDYYGKSAFSLCNNMRRVTMTGPGEMMELNGNMPWKETKVPCVVEIEDGVTNIGAYAFSLCKGLIRVDIPDSMTAIEKYAFNNCTNLTEITIPVGVTSIGDSAFSNCTNLKDIYYGGTEEQWNAAIAPDTNKNTLENTPKVTVHFETSGSEHTESAIDEVLTAGTTLSVVKEGLSQINQANLSKAMLESETLTKIASAEGEVAAVEVNASPELGFAAENTVITGAKVNFPEVQDIKLELGAPENSGIEVPAADKALRFSANLVSTDGTALSTGSLDVPVAITISLPDRNISEKTLRVWHHHNGTTNEVMYTSVTKDGNGTRLTFILDGFSDIVVTYDLPAFSVSLVSGTPIVVKVQDEGETLAGCTAVYAARYENGKMTALIVGTLSDSRITFAAPLKAGDTLFFLDSNSAPLRAKAPLGA